MKVASFGVTFISQKQKFALMAVFCFLFETSFFQLFIKPFSVSPSYTHFKNLLFFVIFMTFYFNSFSISLISFFSAVTICKVADQLDNDHLYNIQDDHMAYYHEPCRDLKYTNKHYCTYRNFPPILHSGIGNYSH